MTGRRLPITLVMRIGGGTSTRSARATRRLRKRLLVECTIVLAASGVLAPGLRSIAVAAYSIPSQSMVPTLQVGDRILVTKIGFRILRGEIIVFRRVPADNLPSAPDLVKRVIGLPGETVSSRGQVVLIDGRPLAEPWLPRLTGKCAEKGADIAKTVVAPGHYYVMGDCRGDSADSRSWGTVPASYIVGEVTVVIWRAGHPYLHWF